MAKGSIPSVSANWPVLKPVYSSEYCQYSVIEYKLKTLYENQEKLLEALRLIYEHEVEK